MSAQFTLYIVPGFFPALSASKERNTNHHIGLIQLYRGCVGHAQEQALAEEWGANPLLASQPEQRSQRNSLCLNVNKLQRWYLNFSFIYSNQNRYIHVEKNTRIVP